MSKLKTLEYDVNSLLSVHVRICTCIHMHMNINYDIYTLICMSSLTDKHWRHFRSAELRALNPPINWLARLSAATTVKHPLILLGALPI